MMEGDSQPSAVNNSGKVGVVRNVEQAAEERPAEERPLPAKVHKMPTILGEIQRKLAPKEAWTGPEDDGQRDSGREKIIGKQSKNTRRKPSLWMTRTKRFCYEASVVGLRYVASPLASPFRRSVWALLLLFGAGFTAFQIQDRVRYFLTRPVSINLRIQHAEEIRFPTVTICNENRITYSSAVSHGI